MPTIKKIKPSNKPSASLDPALHKLLKAHTSLTTTAILAKGTNPSSITLRPSAAVAMMMPFTLLPPYDGAAAGADSPPEQQDSFPGAGASVLGKLAVRVGPNFDRSVWDNLWGIQNSLNAAGCTQMYSPTSLPMTGTGTVDKTPDTTFRIRPSVWMAMAAKQLGLDAHLEIKPAEMVQVGEAEPVPAWWIGSEARHPDLRFLIDLIAPAIGEFFHLLVMSTYVCSKGSHHASREQVRTLLSNSVLINIASTVKAMESANSRSAEFMASETFPSEVLSQIKDHLQVAFRFCGEYAQELSALPPGAAIAEVLNTETAIVYGEVVALLSSNYPQAGNGRGRGRRSSNVPEGADQHWKFSEAYNLYRFNSFLGARKPMQWSDVMLNIAGDDIYDAKAHMLGLVETAFARSYTPRVIDDMVVKYSWSGMAADSPARVDVEVENTGAWDLISEHVGVEKPAGVIA